MNGYGYGFRYTSGSKIIWTTIQVTNDDFILVGNDDTILVGR